MTGLARTIDFSDGWKVAITHQTPVQKTISAWKVFECTCLDVPTGSTTFQKILILPSGKAEIRPACCIEYIHIPSDVMKFLMLGYAEIV